MTVRWGFLRMTLASTLLLLHSGCRDTKSAQDNPSAPPAAPVPITLHVTVVEDGAIADAIKRRRGEWAARSAQSLDIAQVTAAELGDGTLTDSDLIIYPSRYIGQLAEQQQIVPLRRGMLESREYRSDDIFPLVGRQAVAWGERTMAAPLGTPVLCLWYRTDLLESLGRRAPATWAEYDELVALLGDASPDGDEPFYPAVVPLAAPWAGRTLLAQAAASAKHPDHYSTLFDIETMRPLIGGPPFVRALTQLRAAVGSRDLPQVDPVGAYQQLVAGRCAMAIGWPTSHPVDGPVKLDHVGVAELPASRDVYNSGSGQWEPRDRDDEGRVTLLGVSGRLASVTASSRNAPASFRLLAWLAGPEMGATVSAAGNHTTLFRHSQTRSAGRWMGVGRQSELAVRYARVVEQSLSRREWVAGLGIPGADRYAGALDDAVRRSLAGQQSAEASLEEAAAAWETITDALGREPQAAAYRRSLGL